MSDTTWTLLPQQPLQISEVINQDKLDLKKQINKSKRAQSIHFWFVWFNTTATDYVKLYWNPNRKHWQCSMHDAKEGMHAC